MRRSPLACTAILAAIFAAACGGGSVPAPSTDSPAPPEPTVTTAAMATPAPTSGPSADLTGQVAYAAGEDSQVFLLDLATGDARQLTELTPADGDPISRGPLAPALTCGFGVHSLAWSPDGSSLAFAYGGCEAVIYLLELDGAMTRIADGFGPTWSPDGTRIVFRPNVPYCPAPDACGTPPHSGAWNLQVIDVAAGTGPRPLTTDEGTSQAGQPLFSPDGTLLAFTGPLPDASDHPDLFAATYVSNADGSEARLVARGAWPTAWLPDGRLVVVDERTGTLQAVDLASAEAEPMGGGMGPSALAPDGSRLIHTSAGAGGIELTTLDGEVLAEHPGWPGSWAADSRAAVIVDTEGVGGLVVIGRDGDVLGEFPVPDAPLGVAAVAWRPGT